MIMQEVGIMTSVTLPAGGCLLPGTLVYTATSSFPVQTIKQPVKPGKCPKSAGEAILKRDFPANLADLIGMHESS